MKTKRLPLALAIAALPCAALADEGKVPSVVITGSALSEVPTAAAVDQADLARMRAATSDTASLLADVPGVSLYGAGGVSSLPAVHGLADDRLRIAVDGMDLIASCPNHMNPALSYVDPTSVAKLKVYAGIAPVSVAGDSIGGTVVTETIPPVFAAPGAGNIIGGEIGGFYRSNGNARGANLAATFATEAINISYTGATAKADNYKAGGDFKTSSATGRPGHTLGYDEVGSTAYETRNQTLGVAYKGGSHLVEARFGYQDVPEQLYPNQRMDMLDNEDKRINLRYLGQFEWGKLEARAYQQKVDHYMDFGQDKQYNYGALTDLNNPSVSYQVNGMPMYTRSTTRGLSLQGEANLSERDLLRVGAMLQTYRLDDWWPPAPDCGIGNCIGGMAPLTFWNINDGKRDRKAVFGEWEARWNPQWTSLIGARVERVTMDTGTVTGYTSYGIPGATNKTMMGMEFGAMYAGSSVGAGPGGRDAFNAMDRKRNDTNWDLSAMSAYRPSDAVEVQFGYAHKTRSPSLYERYSWSTNTMALVMNNFVGDGNGYVGNPDLKPEVADTLSVTGDWHSADREYQVVATPYYTHVKDYIDARRTYPGSTAANATAVNSFVRLQYVNQEARLYGIDLSGRMPLARTEFGALGVKGLLNYTRGKNLDTSDDLYNIMPLNAKLALTHKLGGWDNALETVMVKAKTAVSDVRNEIKTPGYTLVNLRGSYTWKQARFDVGVENLFDRKYAMPLGGAYTGQGMTMSITGVPWGIAVPGMGRSLYAGVNVKF